MSRDIRLREASEPRGHVSLVAERRVLTPYVLALMAQVDASAPVVFSSGERRCQCGCGAVFTPRSTRSGRQRYATAECKAKADGIKRRQRARDGIEGGAAT